MPIYNSEETPEEIVGIKVVYKIKYLGFIIDNQRDCFNTYRTELINKVQNLSNLVPSIKSRSSNNMIIGNVIGRMWHSLQHCMELMGWN